MEKINRSLNKLANTNQFQQRYEKLKQEIFENERVRLFMNANSSTVTKEMIDKNLGKLYEFTSQSNKCDKCPSLDGCINMMQGYRLEWACEYRYGCLLYGCGQPSVYPRKFDQSWKAGEYTGTRHSMGHLWKTGKCRGDLG